MTNCVEKPTRHIAPGATHTHSPQADSLFNDSRLAPARTRASRPRP